MPGPHLPQRLRAGDENGSTYLWDVASGGQTVSLVRALADPTGAGIWALAFSPDGKTLATGDYRGGTYLPDAATGDNTATLTDPASGSQGVGAVAFSPDGRLLAAGDTNGTTYLWRVS